ncbi:hypothetical protein B0H66DRAFT_604904 [Apodospora peruviana]|uniref:Uncharacterized protein n=1 Tax=Apodospora peruviana TaxID=516989 RepID=A0AAE0M3J6_9PEZI|nr:hypothetical protein B0H66DRAFT_604904 [Apodospora peruviana]
MPANGPTVGAHSAVENLKLYGKSLLGPLPAPWSATGRFDRLRLYHNMYSENTQTGAVLCPTDDPRLGPLLAGWTVRELSGHDDETNDGWPLYELKNQQTGEVMKSDPRMSADALKARDVPLETFTLE